ncbi:ABC transporter permease [Sciscionella marina]|uniref:ABC transporter permease n=1 Tax=Sciscionella marina TaxID=508770 RepID=UPI00035D4EDB|nr:ABC transporter permease [Sciscionella marina]
MTSIAGPRRERGALYDLLADSATMILRNLLRFKHSPGEIIGTIMFPLAMILIFGYIFGSAIPIPGGGNYREFLMPGLFAMGAAASFAGIMQKMANDNQLGVMDRFRSMPASRSAVPVGTSGAELINYTLGLVVTALCGWATGWTAHTGFWSVAAGFGVILLFAFGMIWLGIFLGSLVRNVTTAERLAPLFMPLTMISNTFVPTGNMPAWLRAIADWNPVSALVESCRALFGNPGLSSSTAWSMQHPVATILLWSIALIAVFAPLSVRRFQKMNL